MPVIPALGRLKQEDLKLEANLGNTVRWSQNIKREKEKEIRKKSCFFFLTR
jgi:hypothetical protein